MWMVSPHYVRYMYLVMQLNTIDSHGCSVEVLVMWLLHLNSCQIL